MTIRNLGEFQQLTMLAVLRLGADAYGASIRRVLRDVAMRNVSISAIYVTLVRLEEHGLVTSRAGDTPATGGRPRRCFTVTPKGKVALRAVRSTTDRMWAGVEG